MPAPLAAQPEGHQTEPRPERIAEVVGTGCQHTQGVRQQANK